MWMPDNIRGDDAWKRFLSVTSTFERETAENNIAVLKSADDLEKSLKSGVKNSAFLSIEGSAALGGKLENLKTAYNKGVRIITLTWNGACEAAGGCRDGGGLTAFGKELLCEMKKLGIVADISHLSDKATEVLFEFYNGPVIATHSDSRAVCENLRNLTDDYFKEIVARHGLVGLNFYPPFIGGNDYTDIIPHVDRFLRLGGEKTIALGCDFDGADMPNGINNISDMSKVYELFVSNYGETIADRIFFDNAHEFVKSVLTVG